MSNSPKEQTPQSNIVNELSVAYLTNLYNEVKENLEYVSEIEGYEIPEVWRDRILQPIDFAIAQYSYDDSTSTPQSNNEEQDMSNPAQHYYDVFNDVRNPIPTELAITGLNKDTLLQILKVQAWLYSQMEVSTP